MTGLLSALARLLGDGLGRQIRAAYEAKLAAANDKDRIAADLEIARLEERQANRALGGRITALVQAAWAAPFVVYTFKLVVFDKVLGLGATDPLSPELLALQERIVTLYFGGAAAIGVVKAIRR